MDKNELIPNLFRIEYSKIVAVLCKRYGLASIELAEDFVSDSFLKAAETWKLKGIPDNPSAWLYTVSKNNAKDYFKRNDHFHSQIAMELSRQIEFEIFEIDLSEDNIQDSQLKMLFAVCNPINTNESQITLALRILCGFGIEEIANALLTNKQTINKRISRAKERLRTGKIEILFPSSNELSERLDNVLHILYLLFNEGYYSSTASTTVSKDLCFEAMRMLYILTKNDKTNLPKTNALMALFCFHTSRFDARIDQFGQQILYDNQDRTKWNFELIAKGECYLEKSACGNQITKYHLETLISFWHTRIEFDPKVKWDSILQLYNRLLQIEYSPVTALNRTYALSMAQGKEIALKEALKIELSNNHLYHSLLAELFNGLNQKKQIKHLKIALTLTNNENDKSILNDRLTKASR
ncbi:MAG: sigma-70 family RNA polymerase sigma factor [Cryomorphaceae bacterium]|nr:sigma-70 family RNA polymerase sigma factor [Cryomorphaceae bacterium]